MHKQTRGSIRLREWMRKTKTKQADLGHKIGTHQTNVSAWLQGRPISLAHAVAIERLTKIPAKDWLVEAEPDSGTDVAASVPRSA